MSDTTTCAATDSTEKVQETSKNKQEPVAATGGASNLDDLFSTLRQQISSSDWLEKNTADQWVKENPEVAKEYMEAAKKS